MISTNQLRYTLALQRVNNLGDTSAKKLIQIVGSAEGVFREKKRNLLKIDGIGAFKIKGLEDTSLLDQADFELRFISENNISISYFQDKEYPEKLKHCVDGPLLFFHSGNIDLRRKKLISIVGTRNITSYGRLQCEKLVADIAFFDPVIISGFAYGVDITAHQAALQNKLQTIGCLAHGLNKVYPKAHIKYMAQMREHGGFISEFWSDDSFDRTNFLKRNRIIAGLSEATIVIESAAKGGSLVTADIANSYNREVFAIPGRVTDKQSEGCNNLIKTQQAHVLSSAADLIYMLGWNLDEQRLNAQQTQLFVELSEEEKPIYEFLKTTEKEVLDIIALKCKIPTYKAATLLLGMELKGAIRPLPGKLFQAI